MWILATVALIEVNTGSATSLQVSSRIGVRAADARQCSLEIVLPNPNSAAISIDRIDVRDLNHASLAALTDAFPLSLEPTDTLHLILYFTSPHPDKQAAPSETMLVDTTDPAETPVSPPDSTTLADTASPAETPVSPPDSTAESSPPVFIDEILADPPPGLKGDTNGDGSRKTYEDEFIELYNTGPDTLSIAGWRLGDDDTLQENWFTFPDGASIPPLGRVLLFGGGTPTGFTIPTFADDGRIGNGLTNGGDTVILIDASGDTVDQVSGSGWKGDQSQVRFPPGGEDFTEHSTLPGAAPFSPGRESAATVEVNR